VIGLDEPMGATTVCCPRAHASPAACRAFVRGSRCASWAVSLWVYRGEFR